MHTIVEIRILRTYESCERTSYYVELTTDEGFSKTPNCHRTGSTYTNGDGLSIEEARDRALMDAHEWSDFLGIEVTPYEEDGVIHEPSMKMETFTTRRILKQRRVNKAIAADLAALDQAINNFHEATFGQALADVQALEDRINAHRSSARDINPFAGDPA